MLETSQGYLIYNGAVTSVGPPFGLTSVFDQASLIEYPRRSELLVENSYSVYNFSSAQVVSTTVYVNGIFVVFYLSNF